MKFKTQLATLALTALMSTSAFAWKVTVGKETLYCCNQKEWKGRCTVTLQTYPCAKAEFNNEADIQKVIGGLELEDKGDGLYSERPDIATVQGEVLLFDLEGIEQGSEPKEISVGEELKAGSVSGRNYRCVLEN